MSMIKATFGAIFRNGNFTGWHMFGVLCLFFGTIITVNLTLAFSAATTWTGLMVKNTYVESQKFDTRRAELAPQTKLGWVAQAAADEGALRITLTDRNGKPVAGAIMTGHLGRPVHEGEDRLIAFQAAGSVYESAQDLSPGMWRVQVKAIGPKGEVWIKTLRFVAPARQAALRGEQALVVGKGGA
ncbi:MAG: FixH family protein [Pseudomonadota bacterium]